MCAVHIFLPCDASRVVSPCERLRLALVYVASISRCTNGIVKKKRITFDEFFCQNLVITFNFCDYFLHRGMRLTQSIDYGNVLGIMRSGHLLLKFELSKSCEKLGAGNFTWASLFVA